MIGGQKLSIETGALAKQADGAVVVSYGDSVVLVTAQSAKGREGIDFFPLTVEYREKFSSGGRFPGGFIKREGRPSNREILTMRLIDRPMRPLFPEGYVQEVQIIGNLLSADRQNDPDVLALTGASAALTISSIPFLGPIAGVRVGMVDGEFILNPKTDEREQSSLDLIVAGTRDAVVMVEGGGKQVSEKDVVEAIQFGHEAIQEIIPMIEELREKAGKPKAEFAPPEADGALAARLRRGFEARLRDALQTEGKLARQQAIDALREEAVAAESAGIEDAGELLVRTKEVVKAFGEMAWQNERALILDKGRRVDGRAPDEIRAISVDLGVLPRTHGSAVFTRGETQALATAVLGTADAEQRVEHVMADYRKRFYLDYNFPPYSVGEVRPIRGVGRREIGHGALAEKALDTVIPSADKFSYTIRVVSDILESNGSSSMATVCGATLCLMDAGVPIQAPVAGIAMGLVMEGERYRILSDIAGSEDHNGDMDFKVAGTRDGITALQMDIKVGGLTTELLEQALEQARAGRLFILDKMNEAISEPRKELSPYAPKLRRLCIPVEKIGLLIGPGGRQIKAIQEETGAHIEVGDDGVVLVSGETDESVEKAAAQVKAITTEVEVGQVFDGKVVSIKDFGAFVELAPGQEGLCHVSELSADYVRDVNDEVQLGDVIKVKVIHVDPTGRIKVSRKAVLLEGEAGAPAAAAEGTAEGARPAEAGPRERFDRGGRGGRGGRPDRGEDADRGERSDRGDRGGRRDHGGRFERGPRRGDRGGDRGGERGGDR
ncbi:MAG: polyribonucleotide nucleotidyltransferase, partial [Planctomycetes bacterium]|nr:polyribonucleotide nucleotidyltransferase [Planctomycetota bacterium]